MTITTINFAISTAGLVVCFLGLLLAITGNAPERRTKRYFIAFFSLLVAYVASNFIGQCTDDVVIQCITLFLESALSSVLMLLLMGFLLEQSGETGWRRSPVFRLAAGLWLVYMVLLIYTQFSTQIYFFDTQGDYHRGPYYPVLLIPPVIIMALNLLLLWHRWDRFSKRERIAFAVYIIVPMLTMLIQMLFFGVYVIVLGTAVSALFMFLSIQNDQAERYAMQQAENAQLRMDIMLSQIQPHFLYNALAVIQDLCHTGDTARAEEATIRFAQYLRGNMESLGEGVPVPFEKELRHTQGYLELEQMRFREKLTVRYDVTCTAFQLPTLTLQPIAENAVRHGVRGNPDGTGVVTVATREYPDRYEITVSDDGPGFDPAQLGSNTGAEHVGIKNVRDRLARMCGGTLTIVSAPGEGAAVTLAIPKREEETPC